MKQSSKASMSIPVFLKNAIRSRAASNNQFVAEYLASLVVKEIDGKMGKSQGGENKAPTEEPSHHLMPSPSPQNVAAEPFAGSIVDSETKERQYRTGSAFREQS